MTPSDENECRQMLHTGYHYKDGPSAVRYPRGTGTGAELQPLAPLPIGKGVIRRQGKKLPSSASVHYSNMRSSLPKRLMQPLLICALLNH